MTVYIMGKAQPPALSAKLRQSVHAAGQRQGFDARPPRPITGRSYRRVMSMAEDLLLIAYAQAETRAEFGGLHPDAAAAARWLADVAAKCRERQSEQLKLQQFAADLLPTKPAVRTAS